MLTFLLHLHVAASIGLGSYVQSDTGRQTSDTVIALVNALIISRLDYCNSVLVLAYDIHLRQLQDVLNAAARLIAGRCKFDSISSYATSTTGCQSGNVSTLNHLCLCSTASVT